MAVVFNINVGQSTGASTEAASPKTLVSNGTPTQATQGTAMKSSNMARTQSLAVAAMVGKRVLNYTTSNIGKWTGNRALQQSINNVGTAVGIGIGMMTNPIMTTIACAFTLGSTAIDTAYEQKWDSIRSARQSAMAGETTGMRH